MAGVEFSLADAYVYAMLRYIEMVPAGRDALGATHKLQRWMHSVATRKSIVASRYPDEAC